MLWCRADHITWQRLQSGHSSEGRKGRTPSTVDNVFPWLIEHVPQDPSSSGNNPNALPLPTASTSQQPFAIPADPSGQVPSSFWDVPDLTQPFALENWLPVDAERPVPMAGTQDENLLDFMKFSFPDLQTDDGWWPPLDAPDAQ